MEERVNIKIYNESVQFGYDRFQSIYRKQFDYIYRGEYGPEEWNCGCKPIDGTYFELYRDWTGKKVGGSVRYRYNILLQRACLKRLLKPVTGATELYWNLYEEVFGQGISRNRVILDNSDKKITKGLLRKIAEEAMKRTPEQIEERYAETISQLREQAKENHRNGLITKKGCRGSIPSYKKYLVSKYYDPTLTRTENIEILKGYGISISERTLIRYGLGQRIQKQKVQDMEQQITKEMSRSTLYRDRKEKGKVHRRVSDEEVLAVLDKSLGVNKNKTLLENNGIYVSKARVSQLLSGISATPKNSNPAEDNSGMLSFHLPNFKDSMMNFSMDTEEKDIVPPPSAILENMTVTFHTPDFSVFWNMGKTE